jgi:predicted extracellular nuclease
MAWNCSESVFAMRRSTTPHLTLFLRGIAATSIAFLAAFTLTTTRATAQTTDTPIYTIQGSGSTSPLVGNVVTTTGVVTRLINNGYYIQDLVGDANPATSDGLFIFTSSAPTVAVGQLIRITGRVTEFNTGAASNAITAARPITELTNLSNLQVLGTGYSIAPTPVTLPEWVNDELERYEGMLISIAGPLTVSQNFFQGRFGQVTLSVGGRLETPTNRYRPGPQALAQADENARRRLILDDGTSAQNPNPTPYFAADATLRAGDTVASLTGVLDYGLATASNTGFGDYKLHPTVAPVFVRANPRTAAPENVGGNVKVASFNVLNYFTTFTNGSTASGQTGQGCTLGGSPTTASNCRGASNLAEFNRQRAKIVEALAAINADAVGLMEIQNNTAALQNLVDALNARLGSGTYAAVPDPVAVGTPGTGTDAIKVAMIYKPSRLTLLGNSISDTSAIHNRPPLAQTFGLVNGGVNSEKFTLVVNHFKSKSSCPAAGSPEAPGNVDAGDGQGCWNAQRLQQSQALRSFVATLQARSGSNDVLIIGDLNAYAQEDPVYDLTSSGYVDQIGRFNAFGYSYVFDGDAGRLDHAISTASLSPKVNKAIEWHINTDEPSVLDYNLEFKQPACATCSPDAYTVSPYRSSDHDPVVVGLNLFKAINGGASRDTLTGTAADEVFTGGPGADVMTGGGGINLYRYTSMLDAGDTVTDFVPGRDQLDLRTLLGGLGFASTSVTSDWVRVIDSSSGAQVQIATAGPGSSFRNLLLLRGVGAATVDLTRDVLSR